MNSYYIPVKKLFLISIVLLFVTGGLALNLEEANVMDVEKNSDRFSVTLYHDDSGEDGYANWWQIETMEGEKLGRRKLLHSHGTRNFTRSQSIEIPSDINKLVVRGHDQTHGYGGRAAIYTLDTDEIRFVEQGSEPEEFSGSSSEGSANRDVSNPKEGSKSIISVLVNQLMNLL